MQNIKLQIHSLPSATPKETRFYLASNFNNWLPDDPDHAFKPDENGLYQLQLQVETDILEFKITRGSWASAEGNAQGRERANRVFELAADTQEIIIDIESWTDISPKNSTLNMVLLHPDFLIPQLGRRRRIWACLPNDYWINPDKHYPVVYMQDGQNLFDNPEAIFGSWGIDKALNRLFTRSHNEAQPFPIIIGIENGGDDRINEYAPWHNPEHGGGEGAQYLEFLADTLKPFIDKQLRTLPERAHTGVMGSSMGGLISLYAALERPDVFGMAGVFSPSLWFSKEIFQLAGKPKNTQPVRILFMAGQQESEDMVVDLLDLYETLLDAGHDEHNMHYDLHSDGTHSEGFWAREFEHALSWLFGDNPEHTHGISDKLIRFRLNPTDKEIMINIAPNIKHPQLEVHDYCHNRQFNHRLGHNDNRIPYAEWEECIFSIRLISEGDLVFSRRVHLNQVELTKPAIIANAK
ncbi:MAG: alpha/beta hydrolase-fold protein [Bacteroidota bacterium]